MDAGLLILRVVVGVVLVGHGTQKLFGWFGGHGRRGTGAFFELLGYRPGVLFAVIAGLSEAGGGALLALGFLTPLAGAAVVGVMLNAASSLRGRGPWVDERWLGVHRSCSPPVGASIALTGPGSVSVDHALGLDWSTAWGVGGVALGVGRRDRDASAAATALPASARGQRALAARRGRLGARRRCRPSPPPHHPVVVEHAARRAADVQLRIADAITAFAGSMPFVYIHAVVFACWMLFVESDPWPRLTLIVSLEAIFLSTFVMIGQNRQAEFQRAKADHDFATEAQELRHEHRAHPRDPHADDRDPPACRRAPEPAGGTTTRATGRAAPAAAWVDRARPPDPAAQRDSVPECVV